MSETTTTPSSLQEFVNQGWSDHADDAQGVMDRLPQGAALVQDAKGLPGLAGLIVHVAGEHLGRWQDGLELLARLANLDPFDASSASGQAVLRSQAVLHYCAGDTAAFESTCAQGHPVGDLPPASTRARVLAVATGALAGNKRLPEALAAFQETLELVSYGPAKDDPVVRTLAITGNNLACELEEVPNRTPEQDELLELAAQTARTFWEQAGTWSNVQVAEYRLAMTYLALGRPDDALEHANLASALCQENDASPDDWIFVHEAVARVQHAQGDTQAASAARARAAECLESVDASLQDYARETLDKLDAALAG